MDGCFYWYDNNWHYIRQWDHFGELRRGGEQLEQSDRVVGRAISMLIKLSWTEADTDERIRRIAGVFA